jgi:outer membrane protein, heavy metal efflux system
VPPLDPTSPGEAPSSTIPFVETLEDLEASAAVNNPTLRRLEHEATAEWAKTGYIAKLPDPTISTMFFMPPMHFDPDRQVAELQVSPMIPWLGRLNAEARQAQLEALAAVNLYQAERLKVIAELRENWFKLYVLGKQIATTETDKEQLQSLIKTANARVATGDAQPGDVLMASLEFSALQEQLISYRQQVVATTAELNRLVGRDTSIPITPPPSLMLNVPDWNRDGLRAVARESQPELHAARLRTAAMSWGIEVARLKRRPDLTLGAGWMAMDAPGATMPGAGGDSFTLGVMASIPMWHGKYEAMAAEATRDYSAAQASEDEVALRIDALLCGLWEQAQANQQIVQLYETSILPQARQTFEADQKSLVNNTATFDRVIRDYRTLLNLELGYHRALGQLAISFARIRQTVGTDSPEFVIDTR